jgi:mannosyltransferase OCH1-like enzyme
VIRGYHPEFVSSASGGFSLNFRIPKRIIQTGPSIELPLLSKAAVANIKLLNPDFEHLFFTDRQVEDFIDERFPEYRAVFDAFRSPISRYDFFRYLAVYYYGGFYFDLDVFLVSSLEDLLDYGCVFAFEELNANTYLRNEYGMDWGVGNYAFGAAAGHPFILALIGNCIKGQKDPKWVKPMMKSIPRMFWGEHYVLNSTAPGLVSRTLAEYPNAAREVKVLFPENVLDPKNQNRFGNYGIHLMAGGWRKKKGLLRRWSYNAWLWYSTRKFLKESQKLGKIRSLEFKRNV